MRQMFVAAVCLLALGCGGGQPVEPAATTAGDGWITLFDGTSLDGWTAIGEANWELTDGVVQATDGSGFLVSDGSYADFELRVEFWVDEKANSGVFIRCADPQRVTAATAYEVNVYDTRPDPTYRTGSIVDIAPPASAVDAGGRWNTFEITARGPRLVVVLNGVQTVDVEHDGFAQGPIALQSGVGTVRFRNVQVRAL